MTFPDKLKHLRSIKGCTQRDVAVFLNTTDSCYRNYEKGIREPSLTTLKDICIFFNVSADYLVGLTDEY